ncbi:WD40/YVTN/BNR-like repeat-containing protein [Marinobacterium rhizophilum]|uniref:WD40/YVTN/BNR-like repeat-containing protein n=1 Tax=Marinobacterium rhizophilum TaxID=420402 RepID=UPI00037D8A97|nr:YCF48-related protein [Marinobacterium rhizophilum]
MKKHRKPQSVLQPPRARKSLCVLLGLALSAGVQASDALDEASMMSPLAAHSLLLDIERVGDSLVAVGERGHILISGDEGEKWRQVPAPVRVTLTNTFFVDDRFGWTVGHDGIVLKTEDGGNTWGKVLDGLRANELMLEHAQARLSELEEAIEKAPQEQRDALEAELEGRTYMADDAEAFTDEGPSRPFLDLWFKDRNEGIVVGAFGLILHTTDGGKTWSAWFDRLDNPTLFHLNAIKQIGDQLYIAAEAGTLYRSQDWGQSWHMLDSSYDGSFFGITGTGQGRLVAYGLRGHAFQSEDWGNTWDAIDTGVDSTFFSGSLLQDGSVVLVGAGGVSLHIDARGQVIGTDRNPARLPLSKVLESANKGLLIAGAHGVHAAAVTEGKK